MNLSPEFSSRAAYQLPWQYVAALSRGSWRLQSALRSAACCCRTIPRSFAWRPHPGRAHPGSPGHGHLTPLSVELDVHLNLITRRNPGLFAGLRANPNRVHAAHHRHIAAVGVVPDWPPNAGSGQ